MVGCVAREVADIRTGSLQHFFDRVADHADELGAAAVLVFGGIDGSAERDLDLRAATDSKAVGRENVFGPPHSDRQDANLGRGGQTKTPGLELAELTGAAPRPFGRDPNVDPLR